MKNIRELTKEELTDWICANEEAKFRSTQIFSWLHKYKVESFQEMSNISKALQEKLTINFDIYMPKIYKRYDSKIDDTKKYLLILHDGNIIESVLMKYKFGYTCCVSSQVGCNMGCKFCASTINGAIRNLTVNEMLSQIYRIEKDSNVLINNVVVMGSGEPLLNFEALLKFITILHSEEGNNISLRNITISTCGIVPKIKELATLQLPLTLALSLHAPSQEIRKKIMPIALHYNYEDTLLAMKDYYEKTKRRITLEYSLMKDINCNSFCARELIKNLKKYFEDNNVDFNINLIPVNEVKECNIQKPAIEEVKKFKNILEKAHFNVTIRRTLGGDISGSCGQLRRQTI